MNFVIPTGAKRAQWRDLLFHPTRPDIPLFHVSLGRLNG